MALASDQITIDQLPLAVEISGSDVVPGIVGGLDAGIAANSIKNFVLKDMGIPGNPVPVESDGYISNRYLSPIVSKDFVRQAVAEMLAIADADEGDTCYVLDESVYYKLFQTPASDINNWKIISDPFTVRSVFGRPGPNIEAQHGDYTTDLVPEGEDPLRKYFTQTRFDDAFDVKFPVAFDETLGNYRNQPNGLVGLDIDKIADAEDFRLSNTSQSLKALYESIGKANGIAPLNDLKQIDPQYLPPMPSGYTDEDARNALAAPDFDKILGIKNTAVADANLLDNTANLYIDTSGNEYLKHKISGTVRTRQFAMQGADANFAGLGVNLSEARKGRLQVNNYAASLATNLVFPKDIPLLLNAEGPNWSGTAITPFQDIFAALVPGVPSQTYGNVVRFLAGAYYKTGTSTRTALDICTAWEGAPSDANTRNSIATRLTAESVALRVKTNGAAPDGAALFDASIAFYTDSTEKYYLTRFKNSGGTVSTVAPLLDASATAPTLAGVPNNSMAFYTDSTQDYYIGRVRKNNGTVVNASPLLSASTTAPDFSSATVPNNSLAFYTDSTQGYYIGRIKKDKDTVVDAGAVPRLSYGMPSHTNTLPKDALIFFYDEWHNVICGGRNHTAGSLFEESFVIRASALEPSFDKMLIGGQMQFYVVQYASKFDLYVKIKSMHSNIANTTFKLATSI